jgi:hypothetical protein
VLRILPHPLCLCASVVLLLNSVSAQEVLAPPPPQFAPPANLNINNLPVPTTSTNEAAASGALAENSQLAPLNSQFPPGNQQSTINNQQSPFSLGPVKLRPHLLYRLTYGNGIHSAPGQQQKTLVNELSPGVLTDIGSHWHLDYTPTLRYYSSSAFRDSLDHSANLNWATSYSDWGFNFSQSYVSSSTPLAETASQTDRQNYTTQVGATYALNSKVSLDFGLNQAFRILGESTGVAGLSDSRTWSTTEGFNYRVLQGLSLGLSATFEYDNVTTSSDMTSEQLQGRINWKAGQKLTFALSGGFEDRQFLSGGVPNSINPIFTVSSIYQMFDNTTFTLSALRSVSPSYFQSQVNESTGFTASLNQRLLARLFLILTGGFGTSSYETTAAGVATNRGDDHANINARLTCPFLTHGTASAFYDYTKHTSNEPGFGYDSNQTGLELGYRF